MSEEKMAEVSKLSGTLGKSVMVRFSEVPIE
jgi:hypothetical protein